MSDQETMFRNAMEAAQVGIFVLQDQHFKFVNPFLARLLGYSEDELVGRMGPAD
ncbi:MAG: PAS domain S-box protein, partial [Betaproteobacteria bacterium]|nr:PAS domain S-box protein [Betaproteobacteria bacterium]